MVIYLSYCNTYWLCSGLADLPLDLLIGYCWIIIYDFSLLFMSQKEMSTFVELFPISIRKRGNAMVQANVITSARTDITPDQRRIVHYLLRQIYVKNSWPEGGTLEINHKSFAAIHNISEQEARDDLRRAIADFKGRAIQYSDFHQGVGNFDSELMEVEIDWTIKRESRHKSGTYRITFNPELKSLLMPLAALADGISMPFTVMDELEASKLKLKYSVRLYESLCQFASTGYFKVKVEDLHDRWKTPASYKKYSAFRLYILNKAVAEIRTLHRFSTLTMSEHTNEKGQVTGLSFHFERSQELV